MRNDKSKISGFSPRYTVNCQPEKIAPGWSHFVRQLPSATFGIL